MPLDARDKRKLYQATQLFIKLSKLQLSNLNDLDSFLLLEKLNQLESSFNALSEDTDSRYLLKLGKQLIELAESIEEKL